MEVVILILLSWQRQSREARLCWASVIICKTFVVAADIYNAGSVIANVIMAYNRVIASVKLFDSNRNIMLRVFNLKE